MNLGEPIIINMKEQLNLNELESAKNIITNLLDSHWEKILRTVEDNNEQASVSIGLKLDHTKSLRLVTSRIAYAVKTAEEASMVVPDPAQLEIGL